MTGACEGKKLLKGAKVYVHEKGKAGATVTHIDVEHPDINKILKKSEATYAAGKHGGFFVGLKKEMMKRAEKYLKKKK